MENKNVFIIAEAGVNHNGSIDIARKMIKAAKESGVDAIKFQTFKSELNISKFAPKAEYQQKTTGTDENQLEMVKKLELSFEQFKELKRYCDEIGIEFMSTAFDFDSVDFLVDIGQKIWKIPSGEITNLPYLEKIGKIKGKIILSTGMSTMEEIEQAIEILKNNGSNDIIVLHCTTEYPAPYDEVNLNSMLKIKEKTLLDIGYSDHTEGIEIPIAAVAMGARVIEKHFTLDRNMEGPDHKASIEPDELKNMVISIRNVEKALGSGEKQPSKSEKKNINIARKSIVAKRNIKKGENLSEENLAVKRPGSGITPMKWYEVIGKKAIRDFQEDELIEI